MISRTTPSVEYDAVERRSRRFGRQACACVLQPGLRRFGGVAVQFLHLRGSHCQVAPFCRGFRAGQDRIPATAFTVDPTHLYKTPQPGDCAVYPVAVIRVAGCRNNSVDVARQPRQHGGTGRNTGRRHVFQRRDCSSNGGVISRQVFQGGDFRLERCVGSTVKASRIWPAANTSASPGPMSLPISEVRPRWLPRRQSAPSAPRRLHPAFHQLPPDRIGRRPHRTSIFQAHRYAPSAGGDATFWG